jgi:hypothetical protein
VGPKPQLTLTQRKTYGGRGETARRLQHLLVGRIPLNPQTHVGAWVQLSHLQLRAARVLLCESCREPFVLHPHAAATVGASGECARAADSTGVGRGRAPTSSMAVTKAPASSSPRVSTPVPGPICRHWGTP